MAGRGERLSAQRIDPEAHTKLQHDLEDALRVAAEADAKQAQLQLACQSQVAAAEAARVSAEEAREAVATELGQLKDKVRGASPPGTPPRAAW